MHLQVGTEVIGLEGVARRLEQLPQILHSAPVRKGLRASARILVEVGRSRLRSRSKGYQKGRLERSMRVRVKKRKSGALAGFVRGKGGGNHAHLVDRGTKARYTRKGHYRGVMPANYFWTSTKQSESRRAADAVIRGLREATARL